MTKVVLRYIALAVLFPLSSAVSQVIPAITMSPHGSIFTEGAVERVGSNADPTQYSNLLYGGSIGTFFQYRPWLGIDARLFALASRSETGHEEHQRAAFAGPRFALMRDRLKLYAVALGGISHADYAGSPTIQDSNDQDVLAAATEPALQVGGGADLRLAHGASWRIGEVIYNKMFLPLPPGMVSPNGVTGTVVSTGLVWQVLH